jgi:hypothetical protein
VRTYEIEVIGRLSPAQRAAFPCMLVHEAPARTVLSGDLDQPGLYALLERVRVLGLELVRLKQAPPA